MGLSTQECWSGLPCPPPGDLPDPGMELVSLMSPVLADGFLPLVSPCSDNLLSSVQSLSCVWFFVTPWIAARQASLSIANSRSSLRRTSIESVMPSSHLILGHPLLLLPPIPPSIRVFSNESTLRMRWPKDRSLSLSIILSKEIPGLISFRMDCLDLLKYDDVKLLHSIYQQIWKTHQWPQDWKRSVFSPDVSLDLGILHNQIQTLEHS